ncbi:hypothetical protein SLS63_005127 [Diaporthe eres]|uniref:AAA+ ATPase domain-containing protein n=1 Tax=Diaporthe eres TaxID=83184 RepID=A0ABR1PBI0_DIAER
MASPEGAESPKAGEGSSKVSAPKATEVTDKTTDAYNFMFQTRPMVRNCDWHEFKNRYQDEEGWYAVDALLSSRDLEAEMAFEQLDRKSKDTQRNKPGVTAAVTSETQSGSIDIQRLARVRINSAFILAYLAKVTGENSWSRKPHTFLTPFKTFLHYHSKMMDEFAILQQKYETQGTAPGLSIEGQALTEDNEGPLATHRYTMIDTENGSPKAYLDMACYMELVRTRLLPLYTMFEKADYDNPAKVRYSDIWYLFRHGELIVDGHKAASSDSSDSSDSSTADTQLWRFWHHSKSNAWWQIDDLAEKEAGKVYRPKDTEEIYERYTTICHYYIDFDGEAFAPVRRSKDVGWYEGEKDVTSLPTYPIRFVKNHKQILQRLKARGSRFRDLVLQSHPTMSYMGMTLTHDPLGRRIEPPEYIDSDVVVDFREAYQLSPHWKPFVFMLSYNTQAQSTNDDFGIIEWTDRGRSKKSGKRHEMVVNPEGVEEVILSEQSDSGAFLKTVPGSVLEDTPFQASSQHLSSEDLALLPSRIFVYSLRNRKFLNADIRCLEPIKRQKSSFDKLKIPLDHKTMIQSVVWEHFEKKAAQEKGRIRKLEISDQDFIRGKGRGLIILLHGAPGVGKTATAEAVSDVYKKPLFSITCGDLGIEPKEVEKNLSEIFRLANVWQCILLLDEAEIFLSPREKKDDNLQRNALVSIFLRILEYYPGILFLTTNRPGALDEAVKSRVHVTLLYPQLNRDDTVALFRINIDRLKTIEKERVAITRESEMVIEENSIVDFAEQHFDKFSHAARDCRWNGRQIRNAFQIASSLARYDHFIAKQNSDIGDTGDNSRGLYLGARHFKQVEKATVEYDDFRSKMLGATDSELALHKMERGPELVRRPGPQHGAFDHHRGTTSPSLQRGSQYMSSVPPARDRGETASSKGATWVI